MFKKWFSKKDKEKEEQALAMKSKSEKTIITPQLPSANLKIKKKMALPRNFAKKVIDLEIQCERPDVTKEHVNTLMDLYTVSICPNSASSPLSTTTASVTSTGSSHIRRNCISSSIRSRLRI